MKNIIVIEPWDLEGLQHAEFNRNLIKSIQLAYPMSSLLFFGSERNYNAIQKVWGEAGGAYSLGFLCAPTFDGMKGLFRTTGWLRVLNKNIKNIQPSLCFFLSMQGYSLHLAVKLMGLLNRPIQFRVILHWGYILAMPSYNFLGSRLRFILFSYWNPQNIEYLVLSQHVIKYIGRHAPQLAHKVKWINHPLPEGCVPKELRMLSPIVIGFVGHPFESKGISIFLKIAKLCKTYSNVRFVHVGNSNGAPDGYRDFVDCSAEEDGMLSISSYREKLAALHYAVFPYSASAYADRVSGAFLDALAFEIPIIALKSDLFENLFDEMGGVGYICDSEEGILKRIDQILCDPPVAEYFLQVKALSRGKAAYSIEETAARLRRLDD